MPRLPRPVDKKPGAEGKSVWAGSGVYGRHAARSFAPFSASLQPQNRAREQIGSLRLPHGADFVLQPQPPRLAPPEAGAAAPDATVRKDLAHASSVSLFLCPWPVPLLVGRARTRSAFSWPQRFLEANLILGVIAIAMESPTGEKRRRR